MGEFPLVRRTGQISIDNKVVPRRQNTAASLCHYNFIIFVSRFSQGNGASAVDLPSWLQIEPEAKCKLNIFRQEAGSNHLPHISSSAIPRRAHSGTLSFNEGGSLRYRKGDTELVRGQDLLKPCAINS